MNSGLFFDGGFYLHALIYFMNIIIFILNAGSLAYTVE